MPFQDKEKAKTYQKAHYEKFKEVYKERAKKWYKEHRALCIERETKRNQTPEGLKRRRGYYHKNSAFYVAKTTEWRQKNPEKFKKIYTKYVNARRSRLVGAIGSFSFDSWMQKVEYHGWCCAYCKADLDGQSLTIDHRIPLSKGGSNWLANLVPACRPCNSRKGAKV